MSFIPDRYRCSQCDGYEGARFAHLKGACRCPSPDDDGDQDDLDEPEQDVRVND